MSRVRVHVCMCVCMSMCVRQGVRRHGTATVCRVAHGAAECTTRRDRAHDAVVHKAQLNTKSAAGRAAVRDAAGRGPRRACSQHYCDRPATGINMFPGLLLRQF